MLNKTNRIVMIIILKAADSIVNFKLLFRTMCTLVRIAVGNDLVKF